MIEQDRSLPEPESLSSAETAGSILSSARRGWDLTIEEVAVNLNLSVNAIEAIERDQYDRLPGYTFVKGYIRSYANLLRLNPEEVIATIDLEPERLTEIPSSKGAIKFKGTTQSRGKKKSGSFLRFLLGVLLLAVLLLFGLNQWSKLDTRDLAELFKLPISETGHESAAENEIIFPSNEGSESSQDETKGALIRIE